MTTILITGASGFIGRNLVEFFNGRCEIIAPSHHEMDFTNEKKVDDFFIKNKIDYVIHLAAVGARRNDEYSNILQDNLSMYLNLSRNQRYYQRMIVMSSGAEYDKRTPILDVKEDDVKLPEDPYGISKYYIGQYVKSEKEKIVLLRGFGIYGKYEAKDIRFISNVIQGAMKGTIKVNNPFAKFDYIWVEDLCKIIELFMLKKNLKYNIYNVGSGRIIKLLKLAYLIKRIVNPKARFIITYVGDGNHFAPNLDRLHEEFPDIEYKSLSSGIEDLQRWYNAR